MSIANLLTLKDRVSPVNNKALGEGNKYSDLITVRAIEMSKWESNLTLTLVFDYRLAKSSY